MNCLLMITITTINNLPSLLIMLVLLKTLTSIQLMITTLTLIKMPYHLPTKTLLQNKASTNPLTPKISNNNHLLRTLTLKSHLLTIINLTSKQQATMQLKIQSILNQMIKFLLRITKNNNKQTLTLKKILIKKSSKLKLNTMKSNQLQTTMSTQLKTTMISQLKKTTMYRAMMKIPNQVKKKESQFKLILWLSQLTELFLLMKKKLHMNDLNKKTDRMKINRMRLVLKIKKQVLGHNNNLLMYQKHTILLKNTKNLENNMQMVKMLIRYLNSWVDKHNNEAITDYLSIRC